MGKHFFYLKRDGMILSSGYYEDGKFVVLKGSIHHYARTLSPLMKSQPILEDDMVFCSPSTAGSFCLNKKTCNGWIEWKDDRGNTLDSVYRKKNGE